MWRNPKYFPPDGGAVAERPGPPEPAGVTLLECERNRGAERLRVSLESYNGHQFVRLQCWERNRSGEWWPVRGKCITVKLRELGELVEALRLVPFEGSRPLAREQPQDRTGAARGGRDDGPHTPADPAPQAGFDEFAGGASGPGR